MKKLILFIIFNLFVNSLYAKQLYDVSGIKLGMDVDTVKKILNCNFNENDISFFKRDGKITGGIMSCKNGRNRYVLYFDHYKKIYYVFKEIKFTTKPEFKGIIKRKLIKKYGRKYIKANSYLTIYNIDHHEICWGDCKIGMPQNKAWYGKGIKILSKYAINVDLYEHDDSFAMVLRMKDPKAEKSNALYEKKICQQEKYKKQKKEQQKKLKEQINANF